MIEIQIQWLPTGGIKLNNRDCYLPFVPEDQREHFSRALVRAYDHGKKAMRKEFRDLLCVSGYGEP